MPCERHSWKGERPYLTVVSQNANGNRKAPLFVVLFEGTQVSLSPWGENCAASLFVRFFTSLVMSTQIKLIAQFEASEAQSSPSCLFYFTGNRKCDGSNSACMVVVMVVWVCVSVCASKCACVCACMCVYCTCTCMCLHAFLWAAVFQNERAQLWGLNFHFNSDF